MADIEGADAQRRADAMKDRSRHRRLADERDVALRGDQRVEGVEQHADRGGQPQSLRCAARVVEQQRSRRLQLFGQRRLLSDRRAVSSRQIRFGLEHCGDCTEIDRELTDRLAGDQPPGARVGDDGREQRDCDVDEAAGDEHRLNVHRGRERLARKAQHEHHGDHRLHADGDRPAAEPGHEAADERDRADRQQRRQRPRQGELNRDGREKREREAEAHRAGLLMPRRRQIGDAG